MQQLLRGACCAGERIVIPVVVGRVPSATPRIHVDSSGYRNLDFSNSEVFNVFRNFPTTEFEKPP